jgi:YebC/PmpR family DNA-binding regulatory protein
MAGHSKWANIKRHKAVVDAKKGKLYTKIIREITVAAKISGDIDSNPRLRAAIDKALEANMTRDVIDRAIKRGAGDVGGEALEEVRYEGYGPAGIAVIVDCMTNNRNRTVAEVRHAFSKYGGNLGTDGSVAYLFKKQGILTFAPGVDEERLLEQALEAGAEDILTYDDHSVDVITSPEQYQQLKQTLQQLGFMPVQSELTMNPQTRVAIADEDTAEKVDKLKELLEELDDVQTVYSNEDFIE